MYPLSSFPAIRKNVYVDTSDLCVGEYYYIKHNGSLTHGQLSRLDEYHAVITNFRTISPGQTIEDVTISSNLESRFLINEMEISTTRYVPLRDNGYGTIAYHEHTTCACFSPNGLIIATGTTNNTISLWDVIEGRCIGIDLIPNKAVRSNHFITHVVFSPDAIHLLASSTDNNAYIWDVSSGKLLHSLRYHENNLTSTMFTPEGSTIILGSLDGCISMWDLASGLITDSIQCDLDCNDRDKMYDASLTDLQNAKKYQDYIVTPHVCSVDIRPDGNRIAAIVDEHHIKIWERNPDGEWVSVDELECHNQMTYISYSPDGKRLVTCGLYKGVVIWWADKLTDMLEINHNNGVVLCAKFSPDNKYLTTCGEDWYVRISDIMAGDLVHKYLHEKHNEIQNHFGEIEEVFSLEYSLDNRTIMTYSKNCIKQVPVFSTQFVADEFRSEKAADTLSLLVNGVREGEAFSNYSIPDKAKNIVSQFLSGESKRSK